MTKWLRIAFFFLRPVPAHPVEDTFGKRYDGYLVTGPSDSEF